MPAKIYDWDGWFARGRFVLRRGREYRCTQSSIIQQIRNVASRLGVAVRIEDRGRSVVVTMEKEDAPAA